MVGRHWAGLGTMKTMPHFFEAGERKSWMAGALLFIILHMYLNENSNLMAWLFVSSFHQKLLSIDSVDRKSVV